MAKLESRFQKELIDELKESYPSCVVLKNDASYIQGFPDLTVLYKDKWCTLECKQKKGAKRRPNQEYYVDKTNEMSFSRFVYPENKNDVLNDLHIFFNK